MNNRSAPEGLAATFATKPLSACLESVKIPAKIPRSAFLTDGKIPIISQESDFINGYWDNEADAIHVDSPVVVFGDHTQVLKLVDFDFVVGADGVKILKPKEFLNAAFLRYFLEANPIPSLGYARHYRHISGMDIPLPPLEEQKRIVAVLDQAFAAIDRARAHTEANLADSMELFDRYLSHEMAGVRRTSGLRDSSDSDAKLMKDIVTFHNGDRGKNYPNKNEYVLAGIPWINTGHIMEDGSLSEEKMNFISEAKFKQLGGGKTEVGDLVFCLRGATIGKTAFVGPYSPGAVASSLMIIRPGKEILDKYAYYFLTSELGKSEISRFIGGAAQPNLAGKSVGEFNVPLPSIEQQKRIVERIGAVQRSAEKSKRRYLLKLRDLANLRQSLLQKAFSGQLT